MIKDLAKINLQRKEFILASGSRGWDHDGWQSGKVRGHISTVGRKQRRRRTGSRIKLWTIKARPSDIIPTTYRSHSPLKQHRQVGDQVFKSMSLWGPFLIKPQKLLYIYWREMKTHEINVDSCFVTTSKWKQSKRWRINVSARGISTQPKST